MSWELDYVSMVNRILSKGETRKGRNGTTKSLFGTTLNIDLADEGFPILRGRKIYYKGVLGELAAFFRGPKNIEDFKKFNCNYWDEWGDGEGYLKLDYGNSWLDFNGVDQLDNLVSGIKKDPNGRRHIVTGWRPDKLPSLSLPCCHILYQFNVREGRYIDMIWYQRSADWMVGVPSDAILAAAWLIALAAETGYEPGRITMMFGDTHIYSNHIENAQKYVEQVSVMPSQFLFNRIDFSYNRSMTMKTFVPGDIEVGHYETMPAIKFELNV